MLLMFLQVVLSLAHAAVAMDNGDTFCFAFCSSTAEGEHNGV